MISNIQSIELNKVRKLINESITTTLVENAALYVSINEGKDFDIQVYGRQATAKAEGIFSKLLKIIKDGFNKIIDLFKSHNSLYEKYKKYIEVALTNCPEKLNPYEMIVERDNIKLPNSEDVFKFILGMNSTEIMQYLDKSKDFDDFRTRTFSMFKNMPPNYHLTYTKIRGFVIGSGTKKISDIVKSNFISTSTVSMQEYLKINNDLTGRFLTIDTEDSVTNVFKNPIIVDNYDESIVTYNNLYSYFIEMYHKYKNTVRDPRYVYNSMVETIDMMYWIQAAYMDVLTYVYSEMFTLATSRVTYLKQYMSHVIDAGKKCFENAGV